MYEHDQEHNRAYCISYPCDGSACPEQCGNVRASDARTQLGHREMSNRGTTHANIPAIRLIRPRPTCSSPDVSAQFAPYTKKRIPICPARSPARMVFILTTRRRPNERLIKIRDLMFGFSVPQKQEGIAKYKPKPGTNYVTGNLRLRR